MKKKIGVIGGGPAGLTAAYLLAKAGQDVTVFEADPQYVGGISRTEVYKGYHFDIGGHRFFSKSQEVEDFWSEILEADMLVRPRSSRVYYAKKFFAYPLVAVEALKKLGIAESALCMFSYMQAKLFPVKDPKNFEDWVSNEFGKRLYNIFFKTYTEKVWGISCREISADWAAQRIKGLSMASAIKNAIFHNKSKDKDKVIKTLIDSFRYPRKGPGMMWEVCAKKTQAFGGEVKMGAEVTKINYNGNTWDINLKDGTTYTGFDHVISSAPMRELVAAISPAPPAEVMLSANKLSYRDFITVVLILKDKHIFSDNWIYIHDPSVKVGRIQNFKSWSPEMIPDQGMACYGLEYFCFDTDGLWNTPDAQLIALGKKEIEQVGLAQGLDVVDGYVVRQKKAYPVYDQYYKQYVEVIKNGLKQYPGLHLVGRNGMHKYNNQDHSMMTAMLAVKNILAGKELFNLWQVNEDAEYHETIEENAHKAGRQMPEILPKA